MYIALLMSFIWCCVILTGLFWRLLSFSFLENVYLFFSTAQVNHHKFKEAQSKLGIASAELVQLSNTRWAASCDPEMQSWTLTVI
jgi:hypothetical protein